MDTSHHEVGVLDAAAPPAPPPRTAGRPAAALVWRAVRLVPTLLALGCAAGVVALGRESGWKLPAFSALRGEAGGEKDDWCREHGVPESLCVECDPGHLPRPKSPGWNKEFGVHDCPFDNPATAQTPTPAVVTPADLARARRALAFAPRPENSSKCKLYKRRIQLASDEVAARLGIEVRPVATAPVAEGVTAPGETGYDPTRVVRVSARAAGTVWRVERQVGDAVRAGEVLALVDAAEVGRAKAEFLQALTQAELRAQTLAGLREREGGSVPPQSVREAEAAADEARVRLALAEQTLANLGLPARADDLRGLDPAARAARVQFLGLPAPWPAALAGKSASSNLLPVTAPLDGEVVDRSAAPGEAADPAKPLFTVADTGRVWVTLRVRVEDAARVRPGQPARFRAAGRDEWETGAVARVSPAADEKTRTVAVRVDLPNPAGRYPANTFGTGRVVLREEPAAVVVPTGAVHWEGDCHVVFVRDRNYETSPYKVFHVRTIRPGAADATPAGPVTEVVAGVVPGEYVAVANSGFLRSELLKNNLGEG